MMYLGCNARSSTVLWRTLLRLFSRISRWRHGAFNDPIGGSAGPPTIDGIVNFIPIGNRRDTAICGKLEHADEGDMSDG